MSQGLRFLALDQSVSNTGWALWDEGDDLPQTGAWPLADGVRNRDIAFVTLHQKIGAIHREKPISQVIFEQPIKVPSDKVEKLIALYGLAAHIESIAYIKKIAHSSVGSRKWRSVFLGPERDRKGWSPARLKDEAVARCELYGIKVHSHDEAEAVGILDYQMHASGIQPKWRVERPII